MLRGLKLHDVAIPAHASHKHLEIFTHKTSGKRQKLTYFLSKCFYFPLLLDTVNTSLLEVPFRSNQYTLIIPGVTFFFLISGISYTTAFLCHHVRFPVKMALLFHVPGHSAGRNGALVPRGLPKEGELFFPHLPQTRAESQ